MEKLPDGMATAGLGGLPPATRAVYEPHPRGPRRRRPGRQEQPGNPEAQAALRASSAAVHAFRQAYERLALYGMAQGRAFSERLRDLAEQADSLAADTGRTTEARHDAHELARRLRAFAQDLQDNSLI